MWMLPLLSKNLEVRVRCVRVVVGVVAAVVAALISRQKPVCGFINSGVEEYLKY